MCDWIYEKAESQGHIIVREWVNKATKIQGSNENSESQTEFTPLHYAAFYGNLQLIKVLEIYGADPLSNLHHRVNIMHTSA
jgi:ankyrin repeat protein